MTLVLIAWRLLRSRATSHVLTILILALGVGLITASAASVDAARQAVSVTSSRYPLVVGPRIGPVPLVLGSLTRLQDLSSGIDASIHTGLATDPRVEVAVPLLTGHAVEGYPLLGTTPDYLQPRERFPLAAGRLFEGGALEVVVGFDAASGLGLSLGAEVPIEHRHQGDTEPGQLRVVGILERTNTDADHTLFCPTQAIFHTHAAQDHESGPHDEDHAGHDDDHDEDHAGELLSAVLIRPVHTAHGGEDALLSLQDDLSGDPGLEVALTGQTLRRIADQLSGGTTMLELILTGVLLLTLLSLALSVYGTSAAQARDIVLLRLVGARRLQVVGVVLLVLLAVVLTGIAAGLGVGAALGAVAQQTLRDQMGLEATVVLWSPTTLQLLGVVGLLSALVGVQPALTAYGMSTIEALSGSPRGRRRWSRRLFQIAVAIGLVVFIQQAIDSRDQPYGAPVPLDLDSQQVFDQLLVWEPDGGSPLDDRVDDEITIRGWMVALGDPFEVEDFYLVGMDPTLPQCPFCYRSPGAHERLRIDGQSQTHEVTRSMVEVRGMLRRTDDPAHPFTVELSSLEVVIP